MGGLPADVVGLPDRLHRELRDRHVEEHVGPGVLQIDDLRVDRRVRHLVALLEHDQLRGGGAEAVLHALDVVLPVVVVLIQDADLSVGDVLEDVRRVDPALGLVVGLEAHRPREVLRVVPLGGAGGHEEVRHLLLVDVLVDGGIGRRAERLEQRGDLVLLDQLAHHLDGLGWRIGVVVGDEGDLPAVDATLVVDLLEVGGDRLADRAVRRGGATVGVGVADLDLGRGDADHRLGAGRDRGHGGHAQRECEGEQLQAASHEHSSIHVVV